MSKAATEVTACDREPIHLSGAIQPFGYLIAFNLSNFTVEFASKNVSEFLKIDLDSVLMMTESNFESCLKTVSTGHTHRFESGKHKVIEFEATADETGTADRLLREIESITGAWSSVELFQRMSDATQRLTEFHRVMIYKFGDDWSGTVIAETIAGEMTLEHVFSNLIDNAVKYSGRPEGRIEIGFHDYGTFYSFFVLDQGKGIPLEYLEEIFLPLRSLSGADCESPGMGLAFVKRIVKQAGGEVTVASAPDAGSCFTFTWKKVWDSGAYDG